MHFFFYIYLMLFCSIMLSILAGNCDITLPLPAAVIFYLAIVYGWRVGTIIAVLTGVILEMLYGSYALMPLTFLMVVVITQFWIHHYNTKNISALSVPGSIVGIILFLPQLILYHGSWQSLHYLIINWLFLIMMMTCLVPLTIYLMDKLSVIMGLPLFKDAKIKLIHQKR